MPSFTVTTPVNGDSLVRLGSVAALAWTRSTTTATVTQTAHGLVTGNIISVTATSDAAAITVGAKSITFINANSYSFTCLNAGAASGTITAAHIDSYLINGGYLTIDQDSRYGINNNTSAPMGNITLSATLGGTVEFNAALVRLIPYDGASGNVPVSNTTISGPGGGSGKLIGVYSALNAAPTASGNAMPASGFIKIKQWNSVAYVNNEALTGLTADVNGTDVVGWIEIVGVDGLTATVNRLNTFKVRGAWYEVGTTDGVRATTYQIPSNGSSTFYFPGVWVETAASSGVYEFYPMAGVMTALLANVGTDAVRGKVCWISTAGLLRFGHDGTNSTGGYLPVTGLKIRVPNIFFLNCTQAALTANVLPNATLATRYDFTTTGGGVIDIDKAAMCWFPSFAQPFSVALTNFAALTQILVSEIASAVTWSQVGVGLEATTANPQFALSMATCFAGGTLTDCTFAVASLAASGRYVISLTNIAGFTFSGIQTKSLTTARGNATTGAITATRMASCTWTNTLVGGGRFFLTTCTNCTFTSTIYVDCVSVTTTATNPMYAFDLGSSCATIKIDGLTFGGLALVQPYSGILNVGATGCVDVKLRNLGTFASPLDAGGPRVGATYTRVTTTATVTSIAHGLKTGDIIYVIISDSVAAITVSAKTLLSAADANTFTFTCLNAGAASGSITYYPVMSANLFVLGAAASDVEIKRCYFPHTRTGMYTADNSCKGILIENCRVDYVLGAALGPFLNAYMKGLFAFPAMTAQTSTYGTHWFDAFLGDIGAASSGVPWTRVTTTATVTLTGHNLKTGDFINVGVTSSAAAIVLGQKTVTVLTSSTFTFTCLNAGAASGTIDYQQMTSRIGLLMNEATAETASQYTGVTGTAVFTSAGGLYMPAINDAITFEMPAYCIGHTGFPIAEAVMAGGTIANYSIAYAIDQNDGNGYSSFKNLYYPRAGGGGSNASTNVTMTDTTGVAAGDYVWGTNIAPNAKVQSITNGTTIVVDLANIGVVSGVLRFNQLPSQTVASAEDGFKLKIRITTSTVNATAITSLFVYTLSTDVSRAYQYPLDLTPLSLTNLKNPSEVRVYEAGTTNEIAGQEDVTTGTFTTEIDSDAYPDVDISVLALSYQNVRYLNQTLGDGLSIPVSQVVDRQYLNP